MKNLPLFLLFLLSLSCFAQDLVVIDKIKFKCSYEYKYMLDTTTSKYSTTDILYLQIGSSHSKCLSYYTYHVDSIEAYGNLEGIYKSAFLEAANKGWNKKQLRDALPRRKMKTKVYKNYPKGMMTVTDNVLLDHYQYEDDINPQEWVLHEESAKNILGYKCQKATCKFRGREWTAWFALDIPVSDGPWKFCGLPGLIMEVYDKGEQYYFCINGLQQENETEPIYFGTDGKDISLFQMIKRKDLLKLQYNYFRDPDSFTQMSTGISFGHSKIDRKHDLIERE